MPADEPRPRESFSGVLDADGGIDLSGQGVGPSRRPASSDRHSADAWIADRARRSLMPSALVGESDAPTESGADRLDLRSEVVDRFALGDFAGALGAAELVLGENPDDASAQQYARLACERLEARYTTRIGSLDFIFNRAVPESKVKWLGLDPQAAFLLELADGQTTVAEVLELCGMARLQALRVFTELLEAAAIVRVA